MSSRSRTDLAAVPAGDVGSSPAEGGAVPSPAAAVLSALALVLAAAVPASAQEADTAGAEADTARQGGGPQRFGSFVFAEQDDGMHLLVVPDRNSSLNEGARLFFRCTGDQREVFVAVTGGAGRLGNADDGAGGRYRFGSLPWSEMVTWGSNEAGTAAFMPPRLTESFAGRARESERVEVQIVNPGGVRHRFVFPMDGFAEGASRLACFGSGDGEEDG